MRRVPPDDISRIKIPVLWRDEAIELKDVQVTTRPLTTASPSQPAEKNPFSSCWSDKAETGPRCPDMVCTRRPGSWRTVNRFMLPVFESPKIRQTRLARSSV
jgi:hypothetical protein